MSILKYVLVYFVLCCGFDEIAGNDNCRDCMLYLKCPAALRHALVERSAESKRLFLEALCGFEYIRDLRTALVCCSVFSPAPNVKDKIENHPNVALLPTSCGGINGYRIIGGNVADLYEFPWMTLISYRTSEGHLQFLCSGSIINTRYILTAAHCVKNKTIVGVRVGEYDIRYSTDCQGSQPHMVCESHIQDIRITKAIVHPDYSRNPVENDVALLRVKDPIDFSFKNVGPICLPVTKELRKPLQEGERADVAGWGFTESDSASSVLMKIHIPIITTNSCRTIYSKRNGNTHIQSLTDKEFCAGEIGKDSCSGDSGGPLMIEKQYSDTFSFIQYGIVSRGPRRCGSSHPGIYTDVTKYMDWILDNIEA